jgi:hypothetical protein
MDTKTVIVSGSRTINRYDLFCSVMRMSPWYGRIDTVYVGDAKGVDAMAVRWCQENGITYRIFKAEWDLYGRGAGPERNGEMIMAGGQALIAFWDGTSKGTKNMIYQAKHHELPIFQRLLLDMVMAETL